MDDLGEIAALNLSLAELVAAVMGWDEEKGYAWMMTKNPNFGDSTPADLVMRGRAHKVVSFIRASIQENGLLARKDKND